MLNTNGGKNSFNANGRQLKLGTYQAKLTPSEYLGINKVTASWSSSIFTVVVSYLILLYR